MLTLADIFQALLNVRPEGAQRIAIPQVVVDSRQARAGSLFVALKGEVRDGHDFIKDALARGAVAVIAQARGAELGLGPSLHYYDLNQIGAAGLQPSPTLHVPTIFIAPSSLGALQHLAAFWRNQFSQCQVIGVTGSVGKSSTKELIAAVLRQHFNTFKSEGNLNSETGLPMMVLQMNETYSRAVFEMGMFARGEIRELCKIVQPRIGVVTNVGPTHLERLGSIENIARAKAELVEALPSEGVAILNGEDERVMAMREQTRARVMCYGLSPHCDVWADQIESHGLEGVSFALHHNDEHLHVRVPLLGRHSVHTALAAASVGIAEEMSWDDILQGLSDVAAQLRLIAVPGENSTTILDDSYNASPASSIAALNLLADLSGRKIAVLGDMLELGEMEKRGHELVGGRAAQVVEALIAVGARGKWIGESAIETGLPPERVFFADTNSRAVELVREIAQVGDLVLVKGSRGVKMEEIVAMLARTENGIAEKH